MGYLDRLKKESDPDIAPAGRVARPKKQIVQDIAPPERAPIQLQPRPAFHPESDRRVLPAARGRHDRPEEAGVGKKALQADEIENESVPPSPASAPPIAPKAPEPLIAVHTWEPDTYRRSRRRRRLALSGAGLAVLAGLMLPTMAFPRFSVTITPKVETVTVSAMEFIADTGSTAPQISSRRLPAIAVTVDRTASASFESSGKKFLQERARGTVLISNAFSSAPQALVATARLQDPSGKIFRLRSGVTIPGARVSEGKIVPTSISAEVIADDPGEASNIEATEFRFPGFRGTPKYQGFSARSEQAFTGGFIGEARIVEPEDLRRASEELTRTAIETLRQELAEKIPADPDFFSPAGARELAITRIDQPKAGERHDQFTVSVQARGRAMIIRRSHLDGILSALLLGPEEDAPQVRVAAEQPELIIGNVRLGTQELRLTASGKLAFWREADHAAIASVLHASTPKKAEAYLRGREEIEAFRIKRFPLWLWFIPTREDGLKIDIEPPAARVP